jgi:hypothetical protein
MTDRSTGSAFSTRNDPDISDGCLYFSYTDCETCMLSGIFKGWVRMTSLALTPRPTVSTSPDVLFIMTQALLYTLDSLRVGSHSQRGSCTFSGDNGAL